MKQELSQEIFNEWKAHPVTRALESLLRDWRAARMEEWAQGGLMVEEQFATGLANARGVAECAAFKTVLEVELSQLNEAGNDRES